MAELSQLKKTWIYLVSCVLNNEQPDRELVLKTDPRQLYTLAKAHSMLAVTAFALNKIGIREPNFEQAKTKALRKLALFEIERKKIFDALNNAEIWHCPLKGIILKDCYPMYGMREMTDNDILCDPEKMDDIKLIMEELGYECASFGECNHDIYSKPPCLEFEMHRSLFLRTEMPLCADYFDDVKNKLIAAGKYEYRFTDEDFYIYILAHEYKHFSHRGTGMRSLMDVYVFLNAHPNLDWNYINTELQKLKLTEYEKHSRNLAQKVFKNEALSEDETEQLMMYMDSSVYGTVRPIKGLITHPKGLARDTKRVVKYKSPKHRY